MPTEDQRVEPIYFEGCHWVPAHVPPGMSEAPRMIPLCAFCFNLGIRTEARPVYDNDLRMQRDPIILSCRHPKHAEHPFEALMPDERYAYATQTMGREAS